MKALRLLIAFVLLSVGLSGLAFAGPVCGTPLMACVQMPGQGVALFNTQTTGGATTAVTVTLTAIAGQRSVVHAIEARCNTAAATGDLTITDGGTTIWTSGPLAAIAVQPQFRREWATGLTGTTNSAVVVTLSACTAGTGTLIVQASKF